MLKYHSYKILVGVSPNVLPTSPLPSIDLGFNSTTMWCMTLLVYDKIIFILYKFDLHLQIGVLQSLGA